ncbi:MAG: (Fe-S)-binding protein [Candidatus Bathyarchaeia archaeon]
MLEDYKRDILCCTRCGFCKVISTQKQRSWKYNRACPIHKRFGFDAYSAQGMLYIANALLEGKLSYTEKLKEIIYSCTICGYCDYACKWVHANAEVLDIILELRAKLVEDGVAPLPQHKIIAENVTRHHNIYGKPHEKRFNWMPEACGPAKKAEIVYFVGCTTAYLKPRIAQATVKILKTAGLDFTTLGGEEYCCGAVLWRTGQRNVAKNLIEHNINSIRRTGARTLLVSCAHCYGTFKREYPKVIREMNFEVMHVSELVKKLLDEGRLKLTRRVDLRATYHDPCLLGRLGETYVPWQGEIKALGVREPPKVWLFGSKGVYDAPRKVLRAIPGLELVEMERIREYAWCCGAGGGVLEANPSFALWTAKERIKEARDAAAEAIVSCCPRCALNFERAIADAGERMAYYDLIELVAMALE